MIYDVDYFIKKFEAIPEGMWICGDFSDGNGRHCAQGFCGMNNKNAATVWNADSSSEVPLHLREAYYLINLFDTYIGDPVAAVNNGYAYQYPQTSAKQRMLAALYDIKKLQEGQEGKVKEIIRYVAVDADIRKEAKGLVVNSIDN